MAAVTEATIAAAGVLPPEAIASALAVFGGIIGVMIRLPYP